MPPNGPDDLSTLERLRQRLYTPQAPEAPLQETLRPVAPLPVANAEGWAPPTPPAPPKKRKLSFAALFLGIAALFFVVAIGAALYFLVFGGRSVSTDRIDIAIEADTDIASGDEVTFIVAVENNNPVTITATSLKIDFPDTARLATNPDSPPYYEDTVGDLEAGATGTRSLRVTLFGAENERITIPVRFEYRIEGSNATFVKEMTYDVLITSSPISIRAEATSEVSVGQPLSFAVTVRSSAREPIENVAVVAQYPFGFTPKRGEGPLFPVGTLAPGEERTVTVTGTLTGENSDERVFRFTVGTRDGEGSTLAIPYSSAIAPVTLAKQFLSTSLAINRDSGTTPVIDADASIQGSVSWVNTLATPLLDGQIEIKLSGAALDPAGVSAYGGFYRSSDTTIIYSRETDNTLAQLDPGATGSGSFSLRTKSAMDMAALRNPTITAVVSVAGRRVGESNVPERINGAITRVIKVGTDLALAAKSSYSAGPRPPVADRETSYFITLTLTNTVNTVADASVTGTLPSYVRFVRAVTPADGTLSFSDASRTVTWRAGEIAAGAGYSAPARTATFEVVLLPSASQRGTSPVLMTSPTVSGVDRFTQKQITSTDSAVTTAPSAGSGDGTSGMVQ